MREFLFYIVFLFSLSNNFVFSQNISQTEFSNLIKKSPEYVKKYLILKDWQLKNESKDEVKLCYSNSNYFLDSNVTLNINNNSLISLKLEIENKDIFDKYKLISSKNNNFRKIKEDENETHFVSIDNNYSLIFHTKKFGQKEKKIVIISKIHN